MQKFSLRLCYRSLDFRLHCTTCTRLWSRVNIVITGFALEILMCTGDVVTMMNHHIHCYCAAVNITSWKLIYLWVLIMFLISWRSVKTLEILISRPNKLTIQFTCHIILQGDILYLYSLSTFIWQLSSLQKAILYKNILWTLHWYIWMRGVNELV